MANSKSDYGSIEWLQQKEARLQAELVELDEKLKIMGGRRMAVQQGIAGIKSLLALEGHKPPQPPLPPLPPNPMPRYRHDPKDPLLDTLKGILAREGPKNNQQLVDAAHELGINFGDKNPLRTVNATLMGGAHSGQVARMEGTQGSYWMLGSK